MKKPIKGIPEVVILAVSLLVLVSYCNPAPAAEDILEAARIKLERELDEDNRRNSDRLQLEADYRRQRFENERRDEEMWQRRRQEEENRTIWRRRNYR